MTTKEVPRSNALNDDQSQSCRRRLILWCDCESKKSAAKNKDRIEEIIDYLMKETKWTPSALFARDDKSNSSCADESEKLMKDKKLLKHPELECRIPDCSDLLKPLKLQAKINTYFHGCTGCKVPTIIVMVRGKVPSSEVNFRNAVDYLIDGKSDIEISGEPTFVALLQHKNQSMNDIPDWAKVRSLIAGHWELVKCFPEVQGKGGNAVAEGGDHGNREIKRKFSEHSAKQGGDPGNQTGNEGKERRKIHLTRQYSARKAVPGTPPKEVAAPPAPALITPPQNSEKKPGPIKKAKTRKD